MTLDKTGVVDAIGIESDSGKVVLTVADSWDWADEKTHLLALQDKLNAYLQYIEEGELLRSYPDAIGRKTVIDVICRYPVPLIGREFLKRAQGAGAELEIEIRSRFVPGRL